jgi:competence protein ComEC
MPQQKIHILAVGHGCCVVIESGGRTALYDIGSLSNANLTSATVLPFLRHCGIHHIDALFLSHPDIDHYSGAPELCRVMDVRQVLVSPHFTPDNAANLSKADMYLLDALQKKHIPLRVVHQGDSFDMHSISIDVLWPGADGEMRLSDNDSSLVLQLRGNTGAHVLLCGDITAEIQKHLAAQYDFAAIDAMLLPHHGSVRSLWTHLPHAVQSPYVIASGGFLAAKQKLALQTHFPGRTTLITSDTGAITINLAADPITVETFIKE